MSGACQDTGKTEPDRCRCALLSHYYLRVPSEIVVWIYDALDNNFKLENDF